MIKTFIGIIALLCCFGISSPQTGSNYTQAQADEMVERHNYYRQQVGVKKLKWSNKVAKTAQSWANHLASTGCDLKHSTSKKYGENLFWGYGKNYTPTTVAENWASEKSSWKGGEITEDNYMTAGHYTQMIWYATTEIGCAQAICPNGNIIVVCNYNPPGNMIGRKPTGK